MMMGCLSVMLFGVDDFSSFPPCLEIGFAPPLRDVVDVECPCCGDVKPDGGLPDGGHVLCLGRGFADVIGSSVHKLCSLRLWLASQASCHIIPYLIRPLRRALQCLTGVLNSGKHRLPLILPLPHG